MGKRLLIIGDDAGLNQMLQLHFEESGFSVTAVLTGNEGVAQLQKSAFDLVLLDQQLPDSTGLELLHRIRTQEPDQAIVIMTGEQNLELAIEAIKQGASDFVHKPIKTDALQITIDRVLEIRRLSREVEALQPAAATLAALQLQNWPGKSGELEEFLTQALVQARAGTLLPALPQKKHATISTESSGSQSAFAVPASVLRTLDQVEAGHIQQVLNHTGGHKGKSCDILGISRPALDRKIKKYALTLP